MILVQYESRFAAVTKVWIVPSTSTPISEPRTKPTSPASKARGGSFR